MQQSPLKEIEEFEIDKENLLDSLAQQAESITGDMNYGVNSNNDRIISNLKRYSSECRKHESNPRLLHRLGSTIARRMNDDDLRAGLNAWDEEAIDGFNRDHLELMRLHYRESLARAQEVDAAKIDSSNIMITSSDFLEVADSIESIKNKDGSSFIDEDVPILLRDIAKEIEELSDAENFTFSPERRNILRKKIEAIKNGSIYVGRFLFFTSLFIVVMPVPALSVSGSIASILGVIEVAAPGTIKQCYEKIRIFLPVLPELPISR